jgi:glutaredoxin 3
MGSSSSKNAPPCEESLATVRSQIDSNPVMMYTKTYCGYCARAKTLLGKMKVNPTVVQLDSEGANLVKAVETISGMETVPVIYIGGEKIGGCDALVAGVDSGTVQEKLRNAGVHFEEVSK